MIKGKNNHWIGILLLFSVICFFYYKSTINEIPLSGVLNSIESIENLQVQLHRDLLRYRNNQIHQYDSLNHTLNSLERQTKLIITNNILQKQIGNNVLFKLDKSIVNQRMLVEDFKTYLSILQNSMSYLYNVENKLYSSNTLSDKNPSRKTVVKLVTLLLEYNENPQHSVAIRIYPLIDRLNHNPDSDTNALIIHSLLIIERIPEIDQILSEFNTLNTERQIINIKNLLLHKQKKQDDKSQIFNTLLFICSLCLLVYIIFIFIRLQKSTNSLFSANDKLNHEIAQRTRTEKALYNLVEVDNKNTDDEIYNLLHAICKSLHVSCAYISLVSPLKDNGNIVGLISNGSYQRNIPFDLHGTPCEEVMIHNRLVHNHDLLHYFPDWKFDYIQHPESYIGVTLHDKTRKIQGSLAIVNNKLIDDTVLAEHILTLATPRAIIELHKQIEFNNIQHYQRGLELIDEWIARLITEVANKQKFFKHICDAVREITSSDLSSFSIVKQAKNKLFFISASGYKQKMLNNYSIPLDEKTIFTETINNNVILLINNVRSHPEIEVSLCNMLDVNNVLITPVTLHGNIYGVVSVFKESEEFDKIDEQLITQFGQSVQIAIINMQLVNDINSERERAEVTLHSIGDAVITTNTHGKIEYMNQAAELLTAWELDKVKNIPVQKIFRIIDIDTREPIHDIVKSCLDDGISINKSKLILVPKNNNEIDIESSISPILNTSGNIEGIVIVFHDETQHRQLEKTIQHQAEHDPLTDLLNRDTFDRELNTHVFDATTSNKIHVLCYLDLDRFKLVNDTAGHSAGDQCLIEIASIIQSNIRGNDVFGRLGGDEFGLILKNCQIDAAVKITNNIICAIKSFHFNWDDCDYNLGISIGIVPINHSIKDSADAIRKADLACYTAKDQGRGQVYVYEEQDTELIKRQEEMYWASRIKGALDNNRIKLFAQPIVPLNYRLPQTRHFEILVRLLNEDNQLVPPDAFIPAAERYNLMGTIDKRIIHDSFEFIHTTQKNHHDVHYSINLSGNSLSEGDITIYIETLIKQFDITPQNICFEITETAAIKNLQNAKQLINQLKEIGCQFALDDFGSGLSSFQYLKNLPVDYLKIDGSFVRDMVNNTIDHAMVAAINEVGHVMGIKTIAEYVENEQIINKLKQLNVDYAQGYAISPPQPLTDFFMDDVEEDSTPTLKLVHNKP